MKDGNSNQSRLSLGEGAVESVAFTRSGERSMIPLMFGSGSKTHAAAPPDKRKRRSAFSWINEGHKKAAAPAAPRKRVMVVDDDRKLLGMIRRWLRRESYEVTTAGSGDEAMQIVDNVKPDLVILDMQMPGMSGLTFLRKIMRWDDKPRYPVLVLTGRAELAGFFSNLAVAGFVEKPCTMKSLVERVNDVMSKLSDQVRK